MRYMFIYLKLLILPNNSLNDTILLYSYNRGGNSNEQNAYLLEQENDRLVANELAGKISAIKNLTISINDEMEDQNRLLNNMNDSFDNANTNFSSVARYLDTVIKSANNRSCIYIAIGITIILLIVFYAVTSSQS
ncbi:hypothetical protein BCR36DRAFT_371038 [Piromyces finnis]|uniref:t-SNARE coiled-coil homology domain-containing protein n=1 Tax=Piromyces finnis TaxID=1754191 RepID=A0A1Y1V898_9FUNG|nr:hypothetical protein BCR36DRAFT_371038 [Piromyces finnis]|eukprot:ORX48974.1 hypothetical protein BCR36DRAFT_371038 [Piromyces finnis]